MNVLLFTTNANYSDCPPLGLYSIKAYCEENLPVGIFDYKLFSFQTFNFFELLKLVIKNKPDVLGIGCYVWNLNSVIPLCEKIKNSLPQTKIVLGGPSIAHTDEILANLVEKGIIDYMIMGEGEKTFSELLFKLHLKDMEAIPSIQGLIGKSFNGKVFINPRAKEYLIDLNKLPNPYLLYPELREKAREIGVVYLETSRGCPYNCAYCVAAHTDFTYKDANVIIGELKELSKLGFKNISVLDATLNFNIARTKELLSKIIELDLGLNFEFEIKAECLDEELISMLKVAGLKSTEIGLQSSNENTLKTINRYYDREKFITNVRKLIKSGLRILVDLIIGLPDETIEDWYNSLDFCFDIGNVKISGMTLKILPNTAMYWNAGKYKYEVNPECMNSIISSSTMTAEEVAFAEHMSHTVNAFWSYNGNEELQPYIREICNKHYENHFSSFIRDLTKYNLSRGLHREVAGMSQDAKKELIERMIKNG